MSNGDRRHLLPGLFSDLVRCETRLYNALGERLKAEHAIVTSQFELLRHLRDHPGARVADIAAVFAVGIGAASKSADRLERQGWVERRANPADRRSSLLALTDSGARLTEAAERTFADALDGLVGGVLDAAALAAVGDGLAALRAALEDRKAGTPAG
ncbi:MarR family winged helix-turn-helix transcriptional regulator [Actinacidiphila sp. bgisy144]|uniref:MarR family winged helix-turn-helix transcriptional regulator n=1 Tax=unclassified Actinacidiphila TaxID=2995708 RepID=UPI003EBF6B85